MGTLKPQSKGSLYCNTVIGTLAVDGWAVGTPRKDLGGLHPPRPLLAVPNVRTHPSTTSYIIRCGTKIASALYRVKV